MLTIKIPLIPFNLYSPSMVEEMEAGLAPFADTYDRAIAICARAYVEGMKLTIWPEVSALLRDRDTGHLRISSLRREQRALREQCGSVALGLMGNPHSNGAINSHLPTEAGHFMYATYDIFFVRGGLILRLSAPSSEQIIEKIEDDNSYIPEGEDPPLDSVTNIVRDAFIVLAQPGLSSHQQFSLIAAATELAAPLLECGANGNAEKLFANYKIAIVP